MYTTYTSVVAHFYFTVARRPDDVRSLPARAGWRARVRQELLDIKTEKLAGAPAQPDELQQQRHAVTRASAVGGGGGPRHVHVQPPPLEVLGEVVADEV
eukprot:CAMPEP_0118927388 /NCGR_PEP_ID=MMETSP1169-20130426/4873_1 /TAXON_ID=36882 /ORGANISM="Pyramimonas obovata, Strain CCMP722" /LENGTH=98 /DNA_ID=CAMNT_0006869135 /DNA_START=106 /DNA_END=398 /DNA_ORIENTATION=+